MVHVEQMARRRYANGRAHGHIGKVVLGRVPGDQACVVAVTSGVDKAIVTAARALPAYYHRIAHFGHGGQCHKMKPDSSVGPFAIPRVQPERAVAQQAADLDARLHNAIVTDNTVNSRHWMPGAALNVRFSAAQPFPPASARHPEMMGSVAYLIEFPLDGGGADARPGLG
jgi:hypothetical protein